MLLVLLLLAAGPLVGLVAALLLRLSFIALLLWLILENKGDELLLLLVMVALPADALPAFPLLLLLR